MEEIKAATFSVSEEKSPGLKISAMTLMVAHIFVITFFLSTYTSNSEGMQTRGPVYFPISYSRFSMWAGLYSTKVKLGNPAREFTFQIDAASDMFWVHCHDCVGCPSYTGISGIELNFFHPSQSSTASPIGCLDPKCSTLQTQNKKCTESNSSSCTFLIQYGDATTQGYYVSDQMHTETENFSIIFGCNSLQSVPFLHPEIMVDGIIGLGYHGSVLSQLSSAGVVPMMFTICLDHSEDDSGFLYFGEIAESDIVYTPLVPSRSSYSLNLQSIHVNDQQLNINPSLFRTPTTPEAIVNPGIMDAYLPDDAYNHFVDAINSSLKHQLVQPFEGYDKIPCYMTQSSADDVFPTVQLHFAGGAVMRLHPKNYLALLHGGENSTSMWCMAWVNKGPGSKTTLGAIVLKDKVLVHDIVNQRFGWKDQNCSVKVKLWKRNQLSFFDTSWNYKAAAISISMAVFIMAALILFVCCVRR